MSRERLSVENLGPIQKANIEFGDITVLVGPQASGKSILLQLLRLILDHGGITKTLREHGLVWKSQADLLEVYFGEGTRGYWRPGESRIVWRGRPWSVPAAKRARPSKQRSFLIPAQRVMAMTREGWIRPFSDFKALDPYSIRDFSESLRTLLERMATQDVVDLDPDWALGKEAAQSISSSILAGFELKVVKEGLQRRLMLVSSRDRLRLPHMVWSAGQREFVPLMLGLIWVDASFDKNTWVMAEEIESGLHPAGIQAVLFALLQLVAYGHRLCLATHSPAVLDLIWALDRLREWKAPATDVLKIFRLPASKFSLRLAKAALAATTRVYYFDRENGTTVDISKLDPGSSDRIEAGWGGLTEGSGRVADVIADAVSRHEDER